MVKTLNLSFDELKFKEYTKLKDECTRSYKRKISWEHLFDLGMNSLKSSRAL